MSSFAELELTHHLVCNNGIRVFAAIGGFSGSSTRNELAAGIISMCAYGPVHLASDSKIFVDEANKIIKNLTRNPEDKSNYSTKSDGDLWAYFVKVVKDKGLRSVRFTWVKGHATDEHVAKGIITTIHKEGNHIADACADIGVKCHGEGMNYLASAYNKRHGLYTVFMTKVVKHIVEAHMIHRELIRIAEIKASNSNSIQLHTWAFQPMRYLTTFQRTRKIVFVASMMSFPKKCQLSTCMVSIEKFLRDLYINANDVGFRPITWIELYILYRICGNDKPLQSKTATIGDRAKQVIPLDLQFRHFKNHVRCICNCVLKGGEDFNIFQPAEVRNENLLNVGIEGKQPALGFNISINQQTQKLITKALILLGKNLSNDKIDQFFEDENPTYHKAAPLCFKGKAGWDTRLSSYNGSLEQLNPNFNHDVVMEHDGNKRLMFIVQCPICDKQTPSNDYKFQYTDLGKKVKCTECKKFSCISEWKCNCGVLWHTCKVHYCIEKVKPKPKVKLASDSLSMRSIASKRLLENANHEQILDDDLRLQAKRDKQNWNKGSKVHADAFKRPDIRLTSSMLPKSLREKFASIEFS